MKKTFKSYLGIWTILIVLFNIIAFLFGGIKEDFDYSASFWIGYSLITVAFLGQLLFAKITLDEDNQQKQFYSIPLFTISATGLVVSLVVGGLCMVIPPLPYWVGIIICFIVLAMIGIAILKANIAIQAVNTIDDKVKTQTFFIKALTVEAAGLLNRAQSDELKAECQKVFDTVRYSDPMANSNLTYLESQITIKFSAFSQAVNTNDSEATKMMAREVIALLQDRNNKCKLLK